MYDFSKRNDMKKLYYILALAALLPLFFSCDPTSGTDPDFGDPAFLKEAGRLMPESMTPTTKAGGTAEIGRIVSIELSESGVYALGQIADSTGRVSYKTGLYYIAKGIYELAGLGTLSFDNSQAGNVMVTYAPMGGDTLQAQARFIKATSSNKAYRGWKIEKTRVTVKGWTTVSADFKGCNLAEIAEFLRNNGNKAPVDVPNHSINSISFTGTETMILAYSDGSGDLSEFSLNGNVVTYTWKERPEGFTFITDRAVIEYLDGKCLMTIDGSIEGSTTSGSVTFVMSPLN